MQGLGVPKDYLQAYMWFALAHCEDNLKQVQSEMTPAQILQAQHTVQEYGVAFTDISTATAARGTQW